MAIRRFYKFAMRSIASPAEPGDGGKIWTIRGRPAWGANLDWQRSAALVFAVRGLAFGGSVFGILSTFERGVLPKTAIEAKTVSRKKLAALFFVLLVRRDCIWDGMAHRCRLQGLGIGAHPLEFSILR
ncbi:MAG: hypothetical protein CBD18_06780 [Opitutales bacterium TMED158]|nr:MAG: hypothetical protein CBD18_06780 [Opitutales bacterium TMED158]